MSETKFIALDAIAPNPKQPRRQFEPVALQALADSLRERGGVEQPITVMPNGGPDSYILIDGERRWRAAQLAGLVTIEAVVRAKKSDQDLFLSALIANLHRSDLNAIEEARAYQTLKYDHHQKVSEIARSTGKPAGIIYARLKWMKVAPEVQQLVEQGQLQGDNRIAQALLELPPKLQIALATRLARQHATIQAVLVACQHAAEQVEKQTVTKQRPMVQRATQRAGHTPLATKRLTIDARAIAQATCDACDLRPAVKSTILEPAWTLVAAVADQTCNACDVRSLQGVCDACPAVELLRRIVESSKGDHHA